MLMRNYYYYSELRGIRVHMDGFFHWWAKSVSKNIEECLLSFDFNNEVLLKYPSPQIWLIDLIGLMLNLQRDIWCC
jgi:hypothetical protein